MTGVLGTQFGDDRRFCTVRAVDAIACGGFGLGGVANRNPVRLLRN